MKIFFFKVIGFQMKKSFYFFKININNKFIHAKLYIMNRSDNNFGLYIYFEHSATCESNININSKNKKKIIFK